MCHRVRPWFLLVVFITASAALRLAAQTPMTPPFPTATPESQGLSSEAIAGLVEAVRAFGERDLFVGAELVIIKNRTLVLQETFGSRDRDADLEWQPNTICNIRSMSKTMTGAAAQILIDRGELALSDPVAKYIPAFDNDTLRGITVEHVLTHRSGLPLTAITTAVDQFENLDALVSSLSEAELRFEPGSDFWYSDAGSDTLARVVEVVSGETIDAFVMTNIIEPLGMTDTFYGIDGDEPRLERAASLYIGGPNAWTRFWSPSHGAFYPFAWGSQTAYSTPIDYARFLCMWMDGGRAPDGTQVLSEEAVARTLTPASPMRMLGSEARFPTNFRDREVWYGQMSVLHMPTTNPASSKPAIIGHSGSDGTIAWAWPDRDLIILFYTQSRGGAAVLRLEEPIDRLILHAGEQLAADEAPAELQPFLGTYIANFANYVNEPFEVLHRNGKLALDIPSQMVFELLDADEEGRRAVAVAPTQVFVTFERDEAGNVTLLKLHQGGMVFEVPRKGTALAAEQAKRPVVDPEVVKPFIGRYKDPTSEEFISIYLNGETFCLKPSNQDIELHLSATDEPNTFTIKQVPGVRLRFNRDESGRIISMTRLVGDNELDLPRMKDE